MAVGKGVASVGCTKPFGNVTRPDRRPRYNRRRRVWGLDGLGPAAFPSCPDFPMQIGVPREIKDGECRVGLTPEGARTLVADGHRVLVETGAGCGAGFADGEYVAAGAELLAGAERIFASELVVKVKELQPAEFSWLAARSTVFGFAQLNRDRVLLEAVLAAKVRTIGYETVRDPAGTLPLLAPMSRIAGRLAPFEAASALASDRGGAGVLLTGVDAVPGAAVVIVGAGNVGGEAARVAAALGCRVTLCSRPGPRLAVLARELAQRGTPVAVIELGGHSGDRFAAAVIAADAVIGAVLEPGRLSPKLIGRALVAAMRAGSALVDVGIDQGGIAETSRMTKLSDPTYVEEGVVHSCIPNLPARVARTATLALCAATLPAIRTLAGVGIAAALAADAGLAAGLMTWDGAIVHEGLARDAGVQPSRMPRPTGAG
jgi:alanine dehydrogenase